MWPDPDVDTLVRDRLIPVRYHVKEHAADYASAAERYAVAWTPTVLLLDPSGAERHRIEGFLPKDDFLAQLRLGLAKNDFHAKRFGEAAREFAEIADRFPDADAAPEAQYWAGVSRYKDSGDAQALAATAGAFQKRYGDTVWAKKASVWRPG